MYKRIDLKEAIECVLSGGEVYGLIKINAQTSIEELSALSGLIAIEEQAPTPPQEEPKQDAEKGRDGRVIDHGKICALYNAGWSCTKIADEIGCNAKTVVNHLTKEGVYKKRGGDA